jgi:hypothetical protein
MAIHIVITEVMSSIFRILNAEKGWGFYYGNLRGSGNHDGMIVRDGKLRLINDWSFTIQLRFI